MSDRDHIRFGAGWRQLLVDVSADGPDWPDSLVRRDTDSPSPDIVVDVVRPADLLAFSVEGYGVELVDGAGAHLRPVEGEDARLVFRFAFQHLGEQALYAAKAPEPNPEDPTETHSPVWNPEADPNAVHVAPIAGALPARGSRIALVVPPGTEIPFTTAGLLDALERLEMAVHQRATPKVPKPPKLPPGVSIGPILHLPDGLVAVVSGAEVLIQEAPRGTAAPDPTTLAGMAIIARDTRRVAELMTRSAVVTVAGVSLAEPIGRGPLYRDLPIERVRFRLPRYSSDPAITETAIDAPFRLVVSPSSLNGWTHARQPVGAESGPHRIELWHSRLGVRHQLEEDDDGPVVVDERADVQRIVRAIWARDREKYQDWRDADTSLNHQNTNQDPFLMSLNGADRHILVRQSSEWWRNKGGGLIEPEPVDVESLYLSALGAWLDLHGDWETMPYSDQGLASILTWDHVAPMGRDQYVRVVYPGYLFPFGHRCTLVKVTERKMKTPPSVAGLYQRKFLVVGERLKTYGHTTHLHPFTEVVLSPLITPDLSPDPEDEPEGQGQDTFFFPKVGGIPFRFVLHCLDHEGRKVKLRAPLLWVAEHYIPTGSQPTVDDFYGSSGADVIPADSQDVAFAPAKKGGDTTLPAESLTFTGDPDHPTKGTSTPRLANASVRLPAAENLSPVGAVAIEYAAPYQSHKFESPENNAAEVWAEVIAPPQLRFGEGVGSDRAGGFLQPNIEIAGLSRAQGAVSNIASAAIDNFDPSDFLGSALPKLFGIVPLDEILQASGLADAPKVISEAFDRIEGFLTDLESTRRALEQAAEETVGSVKTEVEALLAQVQETTDAIVSAIQQVTSGADTAQAVMETPRTELVAAVGDMRTLAPKLQPLLRERVGKLADVLEETVLQAIDFYGEVERFATGLAQAAEGRYRYEWRPKVKSWPNPTQPFLELEDRALTIVVEGRMRGKATPSVEVLAELRNFSLILFNVKPMARFSFEHLSFKSGSSGKAEVDVVFGDIEFVGVLTFVQKLRELIPLDGFSDPPYVDVSPQGMEAGFTLGLPNVAIGVFNLSNMSLGADVRVPFLGEVVTVGFNFCTRERPFNLSILMLGGGGWFLMRLAPNGLVVLELGLEAAATLSVDFGVASGSISASLGLYIRLEGDEGSLTAYFRLRGRVSVLGLISASIELYLALAYEFNTGKLVGEAMIRVKVSVFVFSGTVTIRAQRRFASRNGDPSMFEIMGLEADGSSPEWSRYCLAFAGG